MTIQDCSCGATSAHSSALLMALREAESEGLPEAEVQRLGGRYWEGVLRRLCARHAIGEQNGWYFLAGVGRAASSRVGGRSEPSASGPSSPSQLALDVPASTSHWREAA